MTILAFPSLGRSGPSAWTWRKLSNTQTFESPLTRSVQTLELPGARWGFTAGWDNLQAADSALLRAFLSRLRGTAGRFSMPNHDQLNPRGTAGGAPLVNGASQTGTSLVTDGWTAGATLLAGDYIGYGANSELRMVVANATADGTGNMTITLDEPIRVSPADNAALTTAAPVAIFRITDDEVQWPRLVGRISSFQIQAVETFA